MQLMGMMLHRIAEPWGPPLKGLGMSETFRMWGTVGSKDQYGVLVDETASVKRMLGQLCCLHRATARLQ